MKFYYTGAYVQCAEWLVRGGSLPLMAATVSGAASRKCQGEEVTVEGEAK